MSTAIAPIFEPAGFGTWEASGSLITGLIAKEMVVSSMSQVYIGAEAATDDAESVPPTFIEDVQSIVVGFGSATIDAGKQLLNMVTPGIALFPAEEEGENTALSAALQQAYTPLSALAFMVFVLLYVPCIPTLAAQVQEYGWRWAATGFAIQTILPWLLAVLVYQGGQLLGFV